MKYGECHQEGVYSIIDRKVLYNLELRNYFVNSNVTRNLNL